MEKEDFYKLIIENILDIILKIDLDGRLDYITPSVKNLLGYDPGEILGNSIYLAIHPGDQEKVKETIESAIEAREPRKLECRIKHSAGHYLWVEGTGKLIEDESGALTGALITLREISKRKAAEEVIQQREKENAVFAEISRIINSDLYIEEVYERFAKEAKKLIPFDRIAINVINSEEGTITVAYSAGGYVKGRSPGDTFPLADSMNEKIIQTGSSLLLQTEGMEELPFMIHLPIS